MTNRRPACSAAARMTTRRVITVVGLATLLTSPGCAQSRSGAQNDGAKVAVDVLIEVDKLIQSVFRVEVAQLDLEMVKLLPKTDCEGMLRAKFVLETELMASAAEAAVLRAQAQTFAIRFIASKAKPTPADFDDGQPAREVAEKIVKALMVMNKVDNQQLIDKQVEAEMVADGCLTEAYQRAQDAGEVLQNEFLIKYVRSNADRIRALVKSIPLKELYDAKSAFAARIDETRRARTDAVAARTKADEIRRKTATAELRTSRDRLGAELRTFPVTLK